VENGNDSRSSQSPEEIQELQRRLRRIDRSRSRLMVCFYTLPLYIVVLFLLLNQGRSILLIMFVYMGVYAFFAVDMVMRLCPRCGRQFFVKSVFLNFITRHCVHCGTSCRESTSRNSRRF
jgi:hypothetical protein